VVTGGGLLVTPLKDFGSARWSPCPCTSDNTENIYSNPVCILTRLGKQSEACRWQRRRGVARHLRPCRANWLLRSAQQEASRNAIEGCL